LAERFTLGALGVLAAAGVSIVAFSSSHGAQAASRQQCASVRVTDGDTIRCGSQRVRLLGIDAPELDGCPRWRVCAPGDGQASKRSLAAALRFGPVTLRPVTVDRYGRTVAVVMAGSVNLSCWQLRRGQAIYKPQWDNRGMIGRSCGR
jgi:endonuclease YncB( thermonuclease family)